ncbi:hypothetical protein [Luteolibacter soli]|uniref:Uncharacterized protein n=1 Tax=Luteolibacter soli TaxID=3135280 RepID=A0ABU9B4M2_9BACT
MSSSSSLPWPTSPHSVVPEWLQFTPEEEEQRRLKAEEWEAQHQSRLELAAANGTKLLSPREAALLWNVKLVQKS